MLWKPSSKNTVFLRLDESMTQLLQQARRQGLVSDINAVLLVGGTVQMPAVQILSQKN